MNNIRRSSVEISKKLINLKGWFEDVQFCSWEVYKIIESILNNPNEVRKILAEIDWNKKEVEKLKLDSSNWKISVVWWVMLKINPEWDIIEYVDWKFAWEQLFTWNAAYRETQKKWLRLLTYSEFHTIIYNKCWIEKFFFDNIRGEDFRINSNIFLWTFSSLNKYIAHCISFKSDKHQIILDKMFKTTFLFAFWIKK